MQLLLFLAGLTISFILALEFALGGWIGWAGIILLLLRVIGVIHCRWWLAALPLEYGLIACLYMIIGGAWYRGCDFDFRGDLGTSGNGS